MRYKLETEVATFVIQKEPLGMWDLWVNDIPTLTFPTPEEAALAVYEQRSGFVIWDQLDQRVAPPSLQGWQMLDS